MKNQYRESAKWQKFNRVHRIKLNVFMAFTGLYVLALVGGLVAQRYEVLFWGGMLGALLNLVVCLGGQVMGIAIVIGAFESSYRIWHAELGKIFGNVGRQTRLGTFGFYRFVFNPRPVDMLAAILDRKLGIQELGEEEVRLKRRRDNASQKLEVATLKLQLCGLEGKFRDGSREHKLLVRAIRKCNDSVALKRLLEELTAAQPHEEPSEVPNGTDRIAELAATFQAEQAEGTDEEATRLFRAAEQETDRKAKRKKLVEAIGTLRAANKRRQEREEKAASLRGKSP